MKSMSNKQLKLLGLIFLTTLFLISVFVRQKDLRSEMGRKHEWITAHSLLTMEIWDQNGGPLAFGCNPIYSYPDVYNFGRKSLGGVTDEKGLHYYVSYPPFAFIFGYYTTQLMGGPSVITIRMLNVLIHFGCVLFIFLLFQQKPKSNVPPQFNYGGLAASAVYLFSSGALWTHGMLYFVDPLMQFIALACLYLVIRFIRSDGVKNRSYYLLFFLLFFLAVYTEWLGLFLAFFSGLAFLFFYFKRREKRYLIAFCLIASAASIALLLTLIQYASIAGWESLKEYWIYKFSERSGYISDDARFGYSIQNDYIHKLFRQNIDWNYMSAENLFGITGIIFLVLLIIPGSRKKMQAQPTLLFVTGLYLIAALTHYALFYNFNALHAFGAVKAGLVMAFAIGLFVHHIITSIGPIKYKAVVIFALASLMGFKMYQAVEDYHDTWKMSDIDRNLIESANIVHETLDKETPGFSDQRYNPLSTYYSKRDLLRCMSRDEVSDIIIKAKFERAHYYLHDDDKLTKMLIFENTDGSVSIVDSLFF